MSSLCRPALRIYPLLLVLSGCHGQPTEEQLRNRIHLLHVEIARVDAERFRHRSELEAQLIEFRDSPEIVETVRAEMQEDPARRQADEIVVARYRDEIERTRATLCAVHQKEC